ncbi:TPA: N-acetylglucosamine-6-phosphate deacetylase, partial [Vibrio cholerae]|nr:N-acetylglucosamine-6-phosphate deacetylase [Vibrio cholerae]
AEDEALKMASSYPAQAIQCDDLGQLKPNYRAAATVLNSKYESLAVVSEGVLYN